MVLSRGLFRSLLLTVFLLCISQVLLFSGKISFRLSSIPFPGSYRLRHDHSAPSNTPRDLEPAEQHQVPLASLPPIADGRVVVTGGAGNIGKALVRELLAANVPVTILDKIYHPDEFEDILTSIPSARSSLRVKVGDIRDTNVLAEVMTDDVVGVMHLAAVSRVLWCLENERDCLDVNERGTQVVLDALTQLNRRDGGRRWFVLASSREVYGDVKTFPVTEDAPRKPANVYGTSKLKAEEVLERHLAKVKGDNSMGSLYAVALRLSNVYGGLHDHTERLVPGIVTQALAHQTIQIVGGKQELDLVHISDTVSAFLSSARHLTKLCTSRSSRHQHVRKNPHHTSTPRTHLDQINVAAGTRIPVTSLIDKIVRLTNSESALQYVEADDRFPNVYVGSGEKAERILGVKAEVGVDEGLMKLVEAYLNRTKVFLEKEVSSPGCAKTSPTDFAVERLHNCISRISGDLLGGLGSLVLSWDAPNNWEIDERVPEQDAGPYLDRTKREPLPPHTTPQYALTIPCIHAHRRMTCFSIPAALVRAHLGFTSVAPVRWMR